MIDNEQLLKAIDSGISMEELRRNIKDYIYDFKIYAIGHPPYLSSEDGKKMIQYMLRTDIDDLEHDDLCGAPWARTELRLKKVLYNNLDKFWKDESFVELCKRTVMR